MSPRGNASPQGRTRRARPVRNRRENRKRPYLTYHLPRQQGPPARPFAQAGPRRLLQPDSARELAHQTRWVPARPRRDSSSPSRRGVGAPQSRGGFGAHRPDTLFRIAEQLTGAWVSSSGETLLKTEPALPTPPRRRAPGRRTTHFQAARYPDSPFIKVLPSGMRPQFTI